MYYAPGMRPVPQTEFLPPADGGAAHAALRPTVVLTATELDPGRFSAPSSPDDDPAADPPDSEADIRAAVEATQGEIAAWNLAPQGAMDLVAQRAQFLTDACGAVVERLEGAELVYRAAVGSAARSLGVRVGIHKSLSGLCLRTREAVRCDDADRDGRVDKAACRWVGIRSMALVPVGRGDSAVGVLAVISAGVAAFGDRDVWALQLLADVLAAALDGG